MGSESTSVPSISKRIASSGVTEARGEWLTDMVVTENGDGDACRLNV